MSKFLLVLISLLVFLSGKAEGQNNNTTQQNNTTYRSHSQSQTDAYKSEKRSYNMVPGRENDAHNKWLDNQIERNQRDRDRIINQQLDKQNMGPTNQPRK